MNKKNVLTVRRDAKATERTLHVLRRIEDASLGLIRGGAVTISGYTQCVPGADSIDCTSELASGGTTTDTESAAIVRRFRAPPHAAL